MKNTRGNVKYSIFYEHHQAKRLLTRVKLYKSPSIIYSYNNQVERDKLGRARSTKREKRRAYILLSREPEGKRPLDRPRRSWVDNIKLNFGEMGWGGMDWIGLAQDRNR
jgi:hypothetical protein